MTYVPYDDDCRKVYDGDDGLREVALSLWKQHGPPIAVLTVPEIAVAKRLGITLMEYIREKQRLGL